VGHTRSRRFRPIASQENLEGQGRSQSRLVR
jgi:hypothetical protein